MQGLYPFTLLLVLAGAFLFLGVLALGVTLRNRLSRWAVGGARASDPGIADPDEEGEEPGVSVPRPLEAERSDGYEGWLEEPNWRGEEHQPSPYPF